MTTAEVIRRARAVVEMGWAEPIGRRDEEGRWTRRCVMDALELFADGGPQLFDAYAAVEAVALPARAALDAAAESFWDGAVALEDVVVIARSPGADMSLQQWLERPGRRIEEVLDAMDTAALRARAMEAR